MLTGTGIQIGSAVQFGVGQRFPRGLASDGTTLHMLPLLLPIPLTTQQVLLHKLAVMV